MWQKRGISRLQDWQYWRKWRVDQLIRISLNNKRVHSHCYFTIISILFCFISVYVNNRYRANKTIWNIQIFPQSSNVRRVYFCLTALTHEFICFFLCRSEGMIVFSTLVSYKYFTTHYSTNQKTLAVKY